MLRTHPVYYRLAGCAVFSLFGVAGCVCPPCQSAAATGAGQAAAGDTGSAAPSGEKLVVWDGDEFGASAKGWADCDTKPQCTSKLQPASGMGRNDSIGLQFSAQGSGWIGGGWNLFGWWPPEAGHDISGHKQLVFWIKIVAKSPDLAPEAGALNVSLRCSSKKQGCESRNAELKKYAKDNLLDGQWHEIVIPLVAINKPGFDAKSMSEITIGTWAGVPKEFQIYLDDIAFENR